MTNNELSPARRIYVELHYSGMWAVNAEYANGDNLTHFLYADQESAERTAGRMASADLMRNLFSGETAGSYDHEYPIGPGLMRTEDNWDGHYWVSSDLDFGDRFQTTYRDERPLPAPAPRVTRAGDVDFDWSGGTTTAWWIGYSS
jgi:hypothetical protein